MPPAKTKKADAKATCVSKGSGITAGLELCLKGGQFILVDTSLDGRFATDVVQWNSPKKAA
jgi:hypothetical protein